jgi:putative copper export protein/methionine-rich copper-binding protein CopC
LAVAASLFLVPALMFAHGTLRKSEPANGAVLHAAPRVVRLTFNEPPQLAFTRVELVGPDSERVALSPLRVAARDSTAVVVADVAGPLRAGRYRILWQITSADGHPVRGAVAFSIAADATGLAISPMDSAATPALPPVSGDTTVPRVDGTASSVTRDFDAGSRPYAGLRLLTYTGIMVVIGAIVFAMIVVPGTHHRVPDLEAAFASDARSMAARVALLATEGLAVLLVARLVAQSYAVRGGLPDAEFVLGVARTPWGAGFALTGVSLVALALALARRRAVAWKVAALGAIALSLATALSGHAAASSPWTGVAVVSDTVHILAAGGWLGALLLVIVAGVPATAGLSPLGRGSAVRGMVDVFSPMALGFASALAVTGVIAAVLRLGAWSALTGSDYGRILLLKLGVVVLVLIAGAYNWRRMRPALDADRVGTLRRTATTELLFGFVVLAVTAWLVATPPPVE